MNKIIITGGNDGIGLEMVKQFINDNCCVAVLDININNLDSIIKEYPNNLLPFVCDISDDASVKKCVEAIFLAWGRIDYAIHNACKCTFNSLEKTDETTFREVFDINYYGAVHLAKAVIPIMKGQDKGKILFTSSGVGIMGFSNISPYASSKAAIESLAKCLNIEYDGTGISFHILHPPLTRTLSAKPLPVPDDFMADPCKVGKGLAQNIDKDKFIICHSFMQLVQTKMTYLFSVSLGKLMSTKLSQLH
ncbi:MAG: SDR family NAD(P)-dependent oxidoreductase [Lachnospiraceae bacterium]